MPWSTHFDACRTPRGIGKACKGALSSIHLQQLGDVIDVGGRA